MSALDFSGPLAGAGISLQNAAYNTFGAAVDQYTRSLLGNSTNYGVDYGNSNTSSVYIPGVDYGSNGQSVQNYRLQNNGNINERVWNPIGYAEDLIKYQPKHRFLFKVIFDINPSIGPLPELSKVFLSENTNNTFQYIIKRIDKPKFSFDYEEVNMYNFRTKVLKSIKHEPLGLTFIDDIQDTFHNFFLQILRAYSPSSRNYNSSVMLEEMEAGGFGFGNDKDFALRGTLKNGAINPLKAIRIIQYFGHGSQQNEFVFVNPRITDMSYDEAHHEGGDAGNHAEMKFDFDVLYIKDPVLADVSSYRTPGTDIERTPIEPSARVFASPYFEQNAPGYTDFTGRGSNANYQTGTPYFGSSSGQSGLWGIATSVLSGVASSAINNVTNQMLGQVTNPFLGNIARSVVGTASQSITQTARNSIYNLPTMNFQNSNPFSKITE